MKPRRLGWVATLLLVCCSTPSTRLQPLRYERQPETLETAMDRGAVYLLATQNRDGSWGDHHDGAGITLYMGGVVKNNPGSHRAYIQACTALACLALQGCPPYPLLQDLDGALLRGLRFLVDSPLASRADGRTFYNNWTHIYMLQALAVCSKDARLGTLRLLVSRRIGEEVRSLMTYQSLDGGWGYYDFVPIPTLTPTGVKSASFMTAAALVALHDVRAAGFDVPEPCVDRALASLERLRVGDGSYIYGNVLRLRKPSKPQGSLGRSAACEAAFWLHDSVPDKGDLEVVMDRLFGWHYYLDIARGRLWPHETWLQNSGYYYFFGHYYAARCLEFVGDIPQRDKYRAELERHLLKDQDHDGSWWDYPVYGYAKAYGTALALMACHELRRWRAP